MRGSIGGGGDPLGTRGQSGIVDRNRSRCSLKVSIEHPVRSRISGGKVLKRTGPATWKDSDLSLLILLVLPVDVRVEHSLPVVVLSVQVRPQLGTLPSRIFQVYNAL